MRVTFLDPNRGKYRHVLLVYPYMAASGNPICEIVGRPQGGIQAGGILWYGNYLYVADTRRGLRVFDMRYIFDLQRSPNGDSTDGSRIGLVAGKYRSFGYRNVIPLVDAWLGAAGADNHDPGFSCPEELSFRSARNELWTVTEHDGRRMLNGVPR